MPNQTPEQIARDAIDAQLRASGLGCAGQKRHQLPRRSGPSHPRIPHRQRPSLADLHNLPEPADLAEEIIENIEAGLESFRTVAASLAGGP